MKLLVNQSGNSRNEFSYLELPSLKIYSMKELRNCSMPPLFILYEHQLFQLLGAYRDSNESLIGEYSSYIPIRNYSYSIRSDNVNSTLKYNFTTNKVIDTYHILESLRRQYLEQGSGK